jgi:hypothetical protein
MGINRQFLAGLLLATTLIGDARAQSVLPLAITEVMSLATTNQKPAFRGTDYWELTNFGARDLDLRGYGFSDSNNRDSPITYAFTNLIIRAGETIVFFNDRPNKTTVTNLSEFKRWWGESNLPKNLQLRIYRRPGFSGANGDGVWLYDPTGYLVDMVSFGPSAYGRSFVYNPDTGIFGDTSSPGDFGTVKAAIADDYGSPGWTTGPVPLRIFQQPMSQTNNAGMEVRLTVGAGSMPPPHYQWTFQGTLLAGATASSLILSNLQPAHAGDYQVLINNGLTQLVSAIATLTVNSNPLGAVIISPPVDRTVFEGQSAKFSVLARGYPLPSYQWQINGVDLPGETEPVLLVPNCALAMSGNLYTVRIWNEQSATNATVRLVVTPRPMLCITEIMAWPSTGHADWFELTNCGTNAVDLQGYRFADRLPFDAGLFENFVASPAVVRITNSLIIKPRESVIFVVNLPVAKFLHWWGKENLPPGLQIHNFSGLALSSLGEGLYLWNEAAMDSLDTIAMASWAGNPLAISLECTNAFLAGGAIGDCGCVSVLGRNGAWAAPEGGDIGSPGLTPITPPHFLAIANHSYTSNSIRLRCRVGPNRAYRLAYTVSLSNPNWLAVTNGISTDANTFIVTNIRA